jgi:hypothetical protein
MLTSKVLIKKNIRGVVVPIGAVQEGCREDLVAGKMNNE